MSLRDEITNARFTPVRLREGYDMAEVNQFLDDLAAASDRGEALRPMIDQARFTPVRMREGYDMAEVDWFLEQMADRGVGAQAPAAEAPAEPVEPPQDQPPTPSTSPGVIHEQRGLLSRLFGRKR